MAASSLLVYTIQKQLDAGGFEARTCSIIMHQTYTHSNTKNTKTKDQAGQLNLKLPLLIVALLDISILPLFLRRAACQTLEKRDTTSCNRKKEKGHLQGKKSLS